MAASDRAGTEASTTQAAGVHRIRFRSRDATLIDMVADTLDLGCEEPPTADFHLLSESDGSIRMVTDTEWRFANRDQLVSRLIMVVNDFVARTTTDAVLHAAALRSPDGANVVFPAAPGNGKSTLAGVLVQHGWAYLGDESATIRTADLSVVPCAKPVGLDPSSCVVLGVAPAAAGDVPLGVISPQATVVRDATAPPQAVIAPTFVGPDGTAATGTLDFTDALVTLVANTLNLRYVGTPGLETLVELAATVPVHTIAYRSGAEAVAQLAGLGFDSQLPHR